MQDTRSRGYLAALMDTIFDECRALRSAGQQEYAHDDANAYANFERLALRMGLSREQVLMVYLEKHIDGIHSYIQGHKSQRESVVGRINDVIVYLCILRGMVEDSGASKEIPDADANMQEPLCVDNPTFTGSDGIRKWYFKGKLHRLDGPARVQLDGTRHWYFKGQLHRLDGPAIELADGTREWYVEGKRHRLDGPAIELTDGTREWYVNGLHCFPPVDTEKSQTVLCATCKHDHGRALGDPNQSCLRHLAPQVPCGCDKSTLFRYEAALSDIEL